MTLHCKNNNLCANLLLKEIIFRNLDKVSIHVVNGELQVYQNLLRFVADFKLFFRSEYLSGRNKQSEQSQGAFCKTSIAKDIPNFGRASKVL